MHRDAASAELEIHALEEAQAACLRVSQIGERPDIYGPLAERLRHVGEWLKQRAAVGLKDQGRDFYEGVWAGQQVKVCRVCINYFQSSPCSAASPLLRLMGPLQTVNAMGHCQQAMLRFVKKLPLICKCPAELAL